VPGPSVTGPWDVSREAPCGRSYAPRLVRDNTGAWQLIGFVDERDGEFAGELSDPILMRYTAVGGLEPVF
jgi:beta-fructofuranosidase